MIIDVKVPVLAESIEEATLLEWKKAAGDAVEKDEILIEIETDKVVLEVPAPDSGVLKEIVRDAGATVGSDEIIARVDTEGAAAKADAPVKPAEDAKPSAAADSGAEDMLSPAVRKLVTEHDLDPATVAGTGKGGRLTKGDVLAHLEKQGGSKPAPAPTPTPKPAPTAAKTATPAPGERAERRVPMTRIRQRIAERLVQAQHTAAILTTFNEVNMQAVMDLRARHKDQFEKQHGVRLGFMSFFVKASIQGLKRFPAVNAYIEDKETVYHDYNDIGIAVGSPRGLVVPILRNAEQMSFADIEATIAGFGQKAQDGTLTVDELTGGTFTISNGGVFGSLLSTPILNPPQSGILGMHKTQPRPVAENGEVVIRPMMYLALSYDHRIIDGREAVQFLVTIKEALEDPGRMLLDL